MHLGLGLCCTSTYFSPPPPTFDMVGAKAPLPPSVPMPMFMDTVIYVHGYCDNVITNWLLEQNWFIKNMYLYNTCIEDLYYAVAGYMQTGIRVLPNY